MHASLLLGLAVAVGAPVTKDKEPPKKEPAIVGEWVGEKAVAGGMDLPVPTGGVNFTFTADGKLLVREGTKESPDSGTYTIDPKKDPAEVDLIPRPEKKDPKIKGIYKVDGDTLTLCFSKGLDAAAKRPTKFESPAGSDIILITLKRVKK